MKKVIIEEEEAPEIELELEAGDLEDMENIEEYSQNKIEEIKKYLKNELLVPEFNRSAVKCHFNGQKYLAIPMAELTTSNAFLLKIEGQIKKIPLSDIFFIKEIDKEYSFSDYITDLSNYIKSEFDNWECVVDDEGYDSFEDLLEDHSDIWDLQDSFETGISTEVLGKKIISKIN